MMEVSLPPRVLVLLLLLLLVLVGPTARRQRGGGEHAASGAEPHDGASKRGVGRHGWRVPGRAPKE